MEKLTRTQFAKCVTELLAQKIPATAYVRYFHCRPATREELQELHRLFGHKTLRIEQVYYVTAHSGTHERSLAVHSLPFALQIDTDGRTRERANIMASRAADLLKISA